MHLLQTFLNLLCLTLISLPWVFCLLPVIDHSSNIAGVHGLRNSSGFDRLAQVLARRRPDSYVTEFRDVSASTAAASPVNIAIYYETLCPYCQAFITQQLYPLYQKLGSSVINATFVPYGNAKEVAYSGRNEYVCQHGIQECIGNNVHGCLLRSDIGSNSTLTMEFIHCTESSTDYPSVSVRRCGASVGVDYAPIERCAYDYHQYSKIMHDLATKTRAAQPPLDGVPYVQVDGKYEPDATDNLLPFVCQAYKGNKPAACTAGSSALPQRRRSFRAHDNNSAAGSWNKRKLC